MAKYIGVKMVEAQPMLARTFDFITERTAGDGEDPDQEGYCVTYAPDGYQRWCPKAQFEKANFPLEDGYTITQEDIERFVDPEHIVVSKLGEKTAVTQVRCVSGFEITESSACVKPENYDQNIGSGLCITKVKSKLWEHLGFVLQWATHGIDK